MLFNIADGNWQNWNIYKNMKYVMQWKVAPGLWLRI